MQLSLLELSSPITCESHLFTTAASLPTWSRCRHFEPTCLPSAARLVGKRAHCKHSRRLHAPASVCLVQHACERHLCTRCTSPSAHRDKSAPCSSTKLTSKLMVCRFSPAPHDGPASILPRPHFLAKPSFPASINASGRPRSGVVVVRTQQSQQLHLFSSLPWCELRLRCTWRCILCH